MKDELQSICSEIVAATPALIVVLDAEGRIVHANPACERLLGTSAGELCGRLFLEAFGPGQEPGDFRALPGLSGHDAPAKTFRLLCSAGPDERRNIEWSTATIRGAPESSERIILTGIDITEQVGAESVLRQSEARLKALCDNSVDVVAIVNADGTLRFVTPSVRQMLGYSPEEMIGRDALEPVHPDEYPAARDAFDQLVKEPGALIRHTHRLRHADGIYRYVDTYARNLLHEKDVLGIIFTTRDITEHKKADEMLQIIQARQQALFDSLPDSVWFKSLDGIYQDVNPEFCLVRNLQRDAILGKRSNDIYPANVAEQVLEDDREIVRTRQPLRREHAETNEPGARWYDRIKFPVFDEQGTLIGVGGVTREITENKRIELALRETQSRLQALLQSMPDAAWFKDLDGIYREANPAYLARHGLTRDEVIGRRDEEVFPLESARAYRNGDEEVVRTAKSIHMEATFAIHGETRWLDRVKFPVLGENGAVIGVAGVARDITAHKISETALENERLRMKALLDSIPDAAWLKDAKGRYLEVNHCWREENATSTCEPIGKTASDIFPPDIAAVIEAEDREILRSAKTITTERTWTMFGKIFYREGIKGPVLDPAGRVIGTAGVSRDITARKAAERAIAEARQRERALLDSIADSAWLKDADGRYVAVNKKFAETFGVDREDIIGKTDFEVRPEALAQRYQDEDRSVLATRKSARLEECVGRDGEEKWFDVIKTPIFDAGGEAVGLVGTSRDITSRKLADARRVARDAEQRHALVKEVHHRIKNNLQGVIMLIEQHAQKNAGFTPIAGDLISRIKTIAVVHGLHGASSDTGITLCDIVAAIATSLSGLYPDHALDFLRPDDFETALLVPEETVPVALIINELIINAIKHSESAEDRNRVTIRLRRQGPAIWVTVRNPGEGLPGTFDFAGDVGLGTGLRLVKSLLPRQHASLHIGNHPQGGVVAELMLAAPLLLPPGGSEFGALQ